jgi:hypothetical protein
MIEKTVQDLGRFGAKPLRDAPHMKVVVLAAGVVGAAVAVIA